MLDKIYVSVVMADKDPDFINDNDFNNIIDPINIQESLPNIHSPQPADESTVKFLGDVNDDDARVEIALEHGVYCGLSRDDLRKYEHDPFWKKLRIILGIFAILGWLSLLGAAIYAMWMTPGCPDRPKTIGWPERSIIYEINVPTFRVGHNCEKRSAGNVNGIFEILTIPHIENRPSRNYFLNELQPINTYWLRGLHPAPKAQGGKVSDSLDEEVVGDEARFLSELFTFARKRKRFVLIDLLPYELSNDSISFANLNCTFLADLDLPTVDKLEYLANSSLKIRCFSELEMKTRLFAFVEEYAKYVNGFVLDYSPWLLKTDEGNAVLKQLVGVVSKFDENIADSTFKNDFGKKYIFMRMPLIDARFLSQLNNRIKMEVAAKSLGIRAIVETIDMFSDSSCSSSSCLVKLINEVQKPLIADNSSLVEGFNKTQLEEIGTIHRIFAIDDPILRSRALPHQSLGEVTWSPESLAAFVIVALPGSPVIYYGSEIGMSHQSPRSQMKWRGEENLCYTQNDEPYCFCNPYCRFDESKSLPCPSGENFPLYSSYKVNQDFDYPPSVTEQVRQESTGPLKTIKELLKAKLTSDSLVWGRANASLIPAMNAGDHPPVSIVRTANDRFTEYALIIAFAAKGGSFPAEQVPRKCYEEVVFHQASPTATSGKHKMAQGRFDQMVVQAREVRLVKVVHCSHGCILGPANFLLLSIAFYTFISQ